MERTNSVPREDTVPTPPRAERASSGARQKRSEAQNPPKPKKQTLDGIMQYALTLDPRIAEETVKMVGLFPRGYVSLVAGEPGVGKTWFMLDIARAVADGRVGMGDPINPYERGKVLIFAGETGVRMLADRMKLLGGVQHLNSIQVISSHQMSRLNVDVMLNTEVGRKNIEEAIYDYSPDIVFVDTIISFMGVGKDESSQVDMSDSIRMLGVVANACNCAIVLLHHFRKNKSTASSSELRTQNEVIGTSAFTRLSSFVVGLERRKDVRYVHCLKSWWREFNPFMFKITEKEGLVSLETNYACDSEGCPSVIPLVIRVMDWVCKNFAERTFTIGEVVEGTGISRNSVASALSSGLTSKKLKLIEATPGLPKVYALATYTPPPDEVQCTLSFEDAQ